MPSSKVNVAFAASGETKPCDGGKDCPSAPFKDVDTGKWYHVSIDYVLTHSIMNGVSGTSFAPNSNLTRGMLVQILFNLEGKPQSASASFSDVKVDAWYAKAVGWAAANKVVTGYADDTFRPNAAVTREQAAAILYRYAQSKGIDVSVGEDTNILSYADALQASEYAVGCRRGRAEWQERQPSCPDRHRNSCRDRRNYAALVRENRSKVKPNTPDSMKKEQSMTAPFGI